MAPFLRFCPATRCGISELYASVLMIGVTLSLGGVVAAAAISQFNTQSGSAAVAGALEQSSEGKLLSLVYAAVTPGSGGCAASYQGVTEGNSMTFVLFNYGSSSFTPTLVLDNATLYAAGFPSAQPGQLSTFAFTLGTCAHSSGQTLLIGDAAGDEAQVAT